MPAAATLPNERTVTLTRVLDAPRALVWKCWTDPRHLAEWWGPNCFTNPVCEIDVQPGGKIWIVMHGTKGTDYDMDFPMSGIFHEVVPPERLVFTAVAEDKGGNPLLEELATVTFEELPGGKTKLTVHATARGLAAVAPQMLAGMEESWSQSLDRLADLASRLR